MITSYSTIKSVSEGIYKEKGSKFIAVALPIATVQDFDQELLLIKKKYHDARHHCYAYILGTEGELYRANDDGEPNHSAGDPILGQIRSYKLTNTLVVVIRYFGGTKLGLSGLINAYKIATKETLANAKIITVQITEPIALNFPYKSTNEVMKLLDQYEVKVTNQLFEENCKIEGGISPAHIEELKKKVALLNNLGIEIGLII